MATTNSPYGAAKIPASRPSAVAAPSQMVGAPAYNPVRRGGAGVGAGPLGYGAVRRSGPY